MRKRGMVENSGENEIGAIALVTYSFPRGSDPRWFQRVFRVAPGFRQGGAEVCGAIRRKTRPPTGSTSPESRSSVSIHTAARQVRVTPHHSALPCSA